MAYYGATAQSQNVDMEQECQFWRMEMAKFMEEQRHFQEQALQAFFFQEGMRISSFASGIYNGMTQSVAQFFGSHTTNMAPSQKEEMLELVRVEVEKVRREEAEKRIQEKEEMVELIRVEVEKVRREEEEKRIQDKEKMLDLIRTDEDNREELINFIHEGVHEIMDQKLEEKRVEEKEEMKELIRVKVEGMLSQRFNSVLDDDTKEQITDLIRSEVHGHVQYIMEQLSYVNSQISEVKEDMWENQKTLTERDENASFSLLEEKVKHLESEVSLLGSKLVDFVNSETFEERMNSHHDRLIPLERFVDEVEINYSERLTKVDDLEIRVSTVEKSLELFENSRDEMEDTVQLLSNKWDVFERERYWEQQAKEEEEEEEDSTVSLAVQQELFERRVEDKLKKIVQKQDRELVSLNNAVVELTNTVQNDFSKMEHFFKDVLSGFK